MELFQDEEKASSPSGQVPGTGGRTRLSVKPDKSREKSSREHKKTVGCQVGPLLPCCLWKDASMLAFVPLLPAARVFSDWSPAPPELVEAFMITTFSLLVP